MRTRAVFALLAALWLVALATVSAQADEAWVITSFHSDIRIATDSSLSISEDIRVDFGSLQKHGIFRTIPTRYRYDDTHDRYYDLTVQSVTDGSRPVPYTTSVVEDNEVIKIGDAKRHRQRSAALCHRIQGRGRDELVRRSRRAFLERRRRPVAGIQAIGYGRRHDAGWLFSRSRVL